MSQTYLLRTDDKENNASTIGNSRAITNPQPSSSGNENYEEIQPNDEEMADVSQPTCSNYAEEGCHIDTMPDASQPTCSNNSEQGNHIDEMTDVSQPTCSNNSKPEKEEDNGISQIDLKKPSKAMLEAENYLLNSEIERLTQKLQHLHVQFSIEHIKKDDNLVRYYTAFPTYELLDIFINIFKDVKVNFYWKWNVCKISREDQIFMTLIKLRTNAGYVDLAVRFNCCTATVANITKTWLEVMHKFIFQGLMNEIPSTMKNRACLPSAFSSFLHCRVVIDCTDITVCAPALLSKQKKTYSSYKHRHTFKGLIGVAPNGVITYASDLYPGSTSDKEVVRDCGVLDQMKPGDMIMADKGFLISDILPPGVSLNIPPILDTPQFTPAQVYRGKAIARARVHVERAIARVKYFKILEKIPAHFFYDADTIFQVCVALTNFMPPLLKEMTEKYAELEK